MANKKKCKDGWQCGDSCISQKKVCRKKASNEAKGGLEELRTRITFGRMRLLHNGHLFLSDNVDYVGLSDKSKETDSLNVLKELYPDKKAGYHKTVIDVIKSFPEDEQLTLIVGADQTDFKRMEKYFPNLKVETVERINDLSSTAARILLEQGGDLVKAGFARDNNHAELIKKQYNLEKELIK